MFDMSWGEMMVIGGVALIVIGPKELPRALRTLGRMTTKVRRMAGEFQSQFQEAMREAELEDVRKEVEGLNRQVSTASSFNPIDTIRSELRNSIERPEPTPDTPQQAALTGDDWTVGQSEITATTVSGSAGTPAGSESGTASPAAEPEPLGSASVSGAPGSSGSVSWPEAEPPTAPSAHEPARLAEDRERSPSPVAGAPEPARP